MAKVLGNIFLLSCIVVFGTAMASIEKSFESHELVTEIIPVAPKIALSVKYPSGVQASEGNELTPTEVKDQPTVEWQAEPDAFYTLVLTDPDAPSRINPIRREWHHWLVGNIPGNAVDKGDVLTEYVGSGPPKDTGLHRYVFLLYKQKEKIDFKEPRLTNKSGENRAYFSAAKFAEKHSLGEPVAGNFYQAQYDDYVPIVHKQLGF